MPPVNQGGPFLFRMVFNSIKSATAAKSVSFQSVQSWSMVLLSWTTLDRFTDWRADQSPSKSPLR